jgi:hypothetical protein
VGATALFLALVALVAQAVAVAAVTRRVLVVLEAVQVGRLVVLGRVVVLEAVQVGH